MRMPPHLHIAVLEPEIAICHLPPDAEPPRPVPGTVIHSVTVTPEEISVVCEAAHAPAGARVERGWRALWIKGPIDFSLVGVLNSILDPLVKAHVPVFAISTFETDYVLVRGADLRAALTALRIAEHTIEPAPASPD
ncbi:hypothetical protein LI90_1529 [Carbonactinospora thermoautotrophica]|uniref:CASTOR ACT domain-containing protein n=1 Tax=Carbonactinospora thermoautotrophica TaxID=1469144 RepID=A0A132MQ93_9ACTN|nr:ACT domain-containing protein [Carbonactinospora thermoautotrophica]KWW99889.1 hypothetical protein LI90_1529 [Carbonactinospora thermoautotrophica]